MHLQDSHSFGYEVSISSKQVCDLICWKTRQRAAGIPAGQRQPVFGGDNAPDGSAWYACQFKTLAERVELILRSGEQESARGDYAERVETKGGAEFPPLGEDWNGGFVNVKPDLCSFRQFDETGRESSLGGIMHRGYQTRICGEQRFAHDADAWTVQ